MIIRIKPRARADLLAIREWGENTWGPVRAREFLDALIEKLELLQENPGMGRARPAFHPRLRSIRHQGYAIFYCLEEDAPVIVAVLHERRNHGALDFADRIDGA